MEKNSPLRVTLTLTPENDLYRSAIERIQDMPKGKRTAGICKVLADSDPYTTPNMDTKPNQEAQRGDHMETIGIDHGNAAMKTRSFCFPAGIAEYEHEPYTKKDVLEYGGRYYVCGTGRQPFLRDKTSNQRYYLLTLAAIAKEMEERGLPSPADIRIAAGLPLTSYGREKKKFREYLLSGANPIEFKYEGKAYSVNIREVVLYPQAYAALSLHMNLLLGEPSVILADIGGWTVDVMRLDRGTPNASSCRSLELGTIRCMDEIAEQVRRSIGLSVTTAQIETVLRGRLCTLDARAKSIIHREGEAYAAKLIATISESGFDANAMPIIFMGGGANIMKGRVAPQFGLSQPILLTDASLNAKGYERLFGAIAEASGNG